MYCKYCGQQIDDNVAHCPHCGAKQDTSPLEKVENFVDDVTEKVDSSTNRVINNVENAFNMLTELIVGNMTKEEIIKKYGKNNKEGIIISNREKTETKKRFC